MATKVSSSLLSTVRCVFVVLALFHVLLCQLSDAQQALQQQNTNNLRGLEETVAETESAEAITSSLLNAVNAERVKAKLPSLCMCSKLRDAALAHAIDMATRNYMGHTGSNGSTVASRIAAKGFAYTTVGENVAAGQPSVQKVMESWMNSPGHRANILNPSYRFFGSGHAYSSKATYCHYWTQNFAADGARTTCT